MKSKKFLSLIVALILLLSNVSVLAVSSRVTAVNAAYEGGTATHVSGSATCAAVLIVILDSNGSQIAIDNTTVNNGNFDKVVNTGTLTNGAEYTVKVCDLNGDAEGYSQKTFVATLFTATIQAGQGGIIITGATGTYAVGSSISLVASANSGYYFDGWSSSNGGVFTNVSSTSTSFTMPSSNVTITANFRSSQTTTPTSTPTPSPTQNIVVVSEKLTLTGETAQATVNTAVLEKAFDTAKADESGVKTVSIEIKPITGAKEYELLLTKDIFTQLKVDSKAVKKIKINTPIGSLVVPNNMFRQADIDKVKNIGISIGMANTSNLSKEVLKQIGNRPIVEINATFDGKEITWENNDAQILISVPYYPTAEELKNLEQIIVWYIDGKGNINTVPSGRYYAVSGTVTFTTTHFSKYAVAYKQLSFNDIKDTASKKKIEILAAKSIVKGTSLNLFSPSKNMTRGEFIDSLMKALGPTAEFSSNFSDVKPESSYYKAVGMAKKIGIVAGVNSMLFKPDTELTRQDAMVMIYKALQVTKKMDFAANISDLNKFSDASKVSNYAKVSIAALIKERIFTLSGNSIYPKNAITREQAAVMLYNIYNTIAIK